MKKNVLIGITLFILCFFSFSKKTFAFTTGGLGDGNSSPGNSKYCNDQGGCIHDGKGVRITLVDKNGEIIPGTRMVDYWDSVPSGSSETLTGTTFKSEYINGTGPTFGFGGNYSSIASFSSVSDIGGINWQKQHELIQKIIEDIDPKSCVNPPLFANMGYDICKEFEIEECNENLKETYILIEPLFYINMLKHDAIVTGTEFTFLVHKQRTIEAENKVVFNNSRVYNLSGNAGYGTALVGMYLANLNSNDDINYAFATIRDGKRVRYKRLQETEAKPYRVYQRWVHETAFGGNKNNRNFPLGNSMHLVWLGNSADEVCGPPTSCCIPCTEDKQTCKKKYGENYNPYDPECCYADEIWDEKKGICVSKIKYWKNRKKPSYCGPTDQDNPPSTCNPSSITPEFILGVCTEDDSETISYFRDGVFSSSGQISANDENTYEYISTHANTEQCIRSGYMVCLPPEWVKKAVSEDGDNTFLAVASSNDSTYVTPIIPNVCTMYCQEIFEVVLPDNYPYVNAGKYFKWTIKDSENTLASSRGAMLCATEINLDYIVDEYKSINDAAKSAASELANTTCDGKYGIAPVKNAEFGSAEEYLATYEEKCAPEPCRSGHTEPVYDPNGNFVCNALVCDSRWTKKEMTYGMTTRTIYIEGCGGGTSSVKTEDLKTKEKIENYKDAVENWNGKVEPLVQSLKTCGNFSKNYEIDMQTELSYQTLFDKYSYSTPDQINKINAGRFSGDNDMCADNDETADCNKENHIFALSDRDGSEPLTCHSGTWTDNSYSNDDKGGGPGRPSTVLLPVETVSDRDELYQPDNLKVKIITGIYDYDRNSGEFLGSDVREDVIGQWETIKMQVIGEEAFYELNKKINACICKDGYVTDSKNDECVCERKVSYYDFTSQYSNYQKLDDGTLTVEFMNGSGLYPISLKYWTLGSVSYHEGHFDSIATNIEYSKNVPPKICSEDGDKTVCTYGDPDGVCRYVIKNRIIAHPDDKTDCDDGPCVPCEDEPCGPEPTVTCIDDDGSINEECRDLAGLNVIYRVVDLNDPFPEDRSPGTNWIGNEGVITDNRGVSGMQLYSSSEVEPLYSFELTPAVIKEIRKDTANLEDQAKKYTVGTVVYQNGETTGGYSLFIHHTLSKYGTIKIDDDPSFNDTRFDKIKETRDNLSLGE